MPRSQRVNMQFVGRLLAKNKGFQRRLFQKAQKNFEKKKTLLVNEFDRHPVTREIDGGVGASNISNTLGYGNLFTFIGFPAGSNPTEPVRNLLRTQTRLGKVKNTRNVAKNKIVMSVEVNLPSESILSAVTPMPFEGGRSWLYGIERGISGFGNYMYKLWSGSRSGKGIQTKKNIRGGGFRNRRYLTEVLFDFAKRIR